VTDRAPRAGALAGVRVLEHAQMVSGPHCAKMLADLGAEVVKVEPPGRGDRARAAGPFPQGVPHPERSGLFLYLNANKRSVTLDPATPPGQRLLARLAEWCDILVEGPPGARLGDLGLGYDTLAARRPELLMVSITPFGDTGPYRRYAASELVTFHTSGLGYVTPRGATDPAQPPLKAGGRLAEFFAGLNGAVGALAALLARRRTGRGQHVDVSSQECLLPMLRRDLAAYLHDGEVASRLTRSWKIAPNDIVPCRDGHVFIAAVEEAQWQRLVDLMGTPAWAADPRFQDRLGRAAHWESLRPLIEAWTRERSKAEICQAAQARRIPISPVSTAADLLASPHLATRGFFTEVDHPAAGAWPYPGPPYRFSATPWRIRRPAPRLGEHNEEVYGGWLGHSHAELSTLRQTGVI
jgi:crotonobetainyl-CoA:carnitine CoA-transferase CaiB-like acyl-CoA transferase